MKDLSVLQPQFEMGRGQAAGAWENLAQPDLGNGISLELGAHPTNPAGHIIYDLRCFQHLSQEILPIAGTDPVVV